ncbi:hypothetical protein B0H14DRAFT_2601059 [Mycena olivaceomarginata]|nr:hypothetical protein B0H14DRAFT_2601059 [Mycena olivaceomarginata]
MWVCGRAAHVRPDSGAAIDQPIKKRINVEPVKTIHCIPYTLEHYLTPHIRDLWLLKRNTNIHLLFHRAESPPHNNCVTQSGRQAGGVGTPTRTAVGMEKKREGKDNNKVGVTEKPRVFTATLARQIGGARAASDEQSVTTQHQQGGGYRSKQGIALAGAAGQINCMGNMREAAAAQAIKGRVYRVGTGAASERREGGAGGEQQVKAGATGYAVSKRGRATCFEAWVEGGDEQEAGKTALEAYRNGRRRAGRRPEAKEQAKYDEARAQSSPRWRQSSAYDPLSRVAPESAHGAVFKFEIVQKAARTASRQRSEEAEEGPNEGPEWLEASGAQFAQKARTGERASAPHVTPAHAAVVRDRHRSDALENIPPPLGSARDGSILTRPRPACAHREADAHPSCLLDSRQRTVRPPVVLVADPRAKTAAFAGSVYAVRRRAYAHHSLCTRHSPPLVCVPAPGIVCPHPSTPVPPPSLISTALHLFLSSAVPRTGYRRPSPIARASISVTPGPQVDINLPLLEKHHASADDDAHSARTFVPTYECKRVLLKKISSAAKGHARPTAVCRQGPVVNPTQIEAVHYMKWPHCIKKESPPSLPNDYNLKIRGSSLDPPKSIFLEIPTIHPNVYHVQIDRPAYTHAGHLTRLDEVLCDFSD